MIRALDYDSPDLHPRTGRVFGLRVMGAAAALSAAAAPVIVGLLAWPVGGLFAVGYAVAAAAACLGGLLLEPPLPASRR